jgi:hypothetical protein
VTTSEAPDGVAERSSLRTHIADLRDTSGRRLADLVLAVVVIVQAGWLGALQSRGWFYQDDFTFLSQASHRRLDWHYLTMPVNDHLTPGLRFVFWAFAHTSGLHYAPTIVVRVVLQAVATLLLYRLLVLASQSRWLALAVTAVYAMSPLLVPGTLWLASSAALLPAQVFAIVAYDAHIRHARTGRLGWSLLCGLALLAGVAFWEKIAVTAVLLVILSVGWLTVGGVRQRATALIRDWLAWLVTLAPLAAFTIYFVSHGYGGSAHDLTVHDGARLVWLQWGHGLWPAVIGAPWRWLSAGSTFTAVANPAVVTIVLGQVAFVALAAAGWRRNRWRGLLVWILPAVSVGIGAVLVGLGRFQDFGTLSGVTFSYAFDLAVPTALAAALALGSRAPLTATAHPSPSPERHHVRLAAAAGLVLVVAVVASSVVSAVVWTQRWHDSPARAYTSRLLAGTSRLGPTANLYDTPVSARVLPLISPNRYLSDLLSIGGDRTAFDSSGSTPAVADAAGNVRPSRFVVVSTGSLTHNHFCSTLIRGRTTEEVVLRPTPPPGDYFLRLEYFQQHASTVTVTVLNRFGHRIATRADPNVTLSQRLGLTLLPLVTSSPAALRVTGSNAQTNVCLATIQVGAPVVASP